MADSLEQMLQDGERVLFRAPMAAAPKRARTMALVGIILAAGLGKFLLLVGADSGLIAVLAAIWIAKVLRIAVWECTTEALVTDRRVLHRSGWSGSWICELPLQEIEEVNVRGNKLQATLASGGTRRLDHPHHARELALALAAATGLRPPRLPWPKEAVADQSILFSSLITGALTAAFFVHGVAGSHDGSPASLMILSLLVAVSFAAGALTGGLIGLHLLRHHFTPEEIQHWIRMSELFSPAFEPERSHRWLKQLFAAVASVIYDRPIQWED